LRFFVPWDIRRHSRLFGGRAVREIIRLVSSAGTGYTYYTTKNKKAKPDKISLKKFDPTPGVRRHVEFSEAKMPSPKKN